MLWPCYDSVCIYLTVDAITLFVFIQRRGHAMILFVFECRHYGHAITLFVFIQRHVHAMILFVFI